MWKLWLLFFALGLLYAWGGLWVCLLVDKYRPTVLKACGLDNALGAHLLLAAWPVALPAVLAWGGLAKGRRRAAL